MSISRFLKFSSLAGIGGYTGYVLHQNDWNPRHIGIVRFGFAAYAVGQIAFDYKFSVLKLRDDSEETLEKWSQCHQRAANRLLRLCSTNGGVFIKVGQHIAALDYLVPKEYVNTLKVLHSQAPRSKFSDIKKVIEKELGDKLDNIFDEFDEKAIASASLAQVYRAKLCNSNETVAVKVQHPKVFQHSLVDIATMEFLFNVIDRLFPEFSLMWLVNETKRNIPLELDFVNEAKNSEKIAILLKDLQWLKIPHIYWKYTTKRVLMMEFVEGTSITDKEFFLANRMNCQEIANRFENMYGRMIYTYGTVHCDPHPGNVLVKKTSNKDFYLYLLDHGLYTQLTDEFRQNYSAFWMAIFRGDLKQIQERAIRMGIEEKDAQLLSCMVTAKPWSAISRGLENRPKDQTIISEEKNELRKNASLYVHNISQILGKVDRQLLLIMKTNDLIRNISHVLGCDERRSLLNMNRYCIQTVYEQRLSQCQNNNIFKRFAIHLQTRYLYFKLSLYSFYLWIDSWFTTTRLSC
uniref:Uncharacterized aarF domain-containing protein kinase 1-like n=1 Tax=Dermatophagoides pteronyssinus TaxID=6956 RepID=A0A6P6Y744_DERPT|nr:uncharacterized aarF domain-containing protein kinase 1-like [Dermatophagoides pteronyssinus]